MFRPTLLALTLSAAPALADPVTLDTDRTVTDAMNALEQAVTDAGATIFARVDHRTGAVDVDQTLPPMEVLIFGNPQLGTPAMMDDLRAGLALPMKVLIYEDDGQTKITYEPAADLFEGLNIDPAAAYVTEMDNALQTLTAAAAG